MPLDGVALLRVTDSDEFVVRSPAVTATAPSADEGRARVGRRMAARDSDSGDERDFGSDSDIESGSGGRRRVQPAPQLADYGYGAAPRGENPFATDLLEELAGQGSSLIAGVRSFGTAASSSSPGAAQTSGRPDDGSTSLTLQELGPTSLFGVGSLLLDFPVATLDFVADSDVTLHSIDFGYIHHCLRQSPPLAAALFRYIATTTGEQVEALYSLIADKRLQMQRSSGESGLALVRLLDGLPIKREEPVRMLPPLPQLAIDAPRCSPSLSLSLIRRAGRVPCQKETRLLAA
jgi:hypothetical protein